MSIILLENIVIYALLAIPKAFQQIAFEQPNVATYKFPFLLLAEIIVPLVFISNIVGFVILSRQRTKRYFKIDQKLKIQISHGKY